VRPALVLSAFALISILPWMAKDWVEVANPVAPFANRYFPNPYVHVSDEEGWRHYLRTYGITNFAEVPWDLTVSGEKVDGFLGPLFLLTPLALLALRFPAGRQLLLAGGIFTLPYFSNIGARFLIPAVPYVSLSLALACGDLTWLLLLLTLAQAVVSLPTVYKHYAPAGWALRKVSPKAALRLVSEDAYLSAQSDEYDIARMVDRLVPPGQRIFTWTPTAESYTTRDFLVAWQSATGETLQDVIWTPMFQDYAPTLALKFHFSPTQLQRIRLVQTAAVKDMLWSVSELRVLSGGRELERAPEWRLTAHPNPWEVQLAFDNSPATRWRSWQDAQPGMHMDVDFGREQTIDSVIVETSNDSSGARLKLEGMTPDGKWTTLSDHADESRQEIRANLRLAATAEFKARSIRYLLIDDRDPRADDFYRYASVWGITNIGRWKSRRLYYIR
jgi:F5/8 type C domain